jgi:ribosome-associated translation inhibitor RaiA
MVVTALRRRGAATGRSRGNRGRANQVAKEMAMAVLTRTTVRAVGVDVSDRLKRYLDRRLLFALGRFGQRVTAVRIWLSDVNGPKGGTDKKCTIAARLRGAGEVRIEEVGTGLCAAIDCAVGRLDRAVSRRIERGQELRTARLGWDGRWPAVSRN